MTSTPEEWDDVGCLRLEVGMNATELQKLRDEVALMHAHQKKERCQAKVAFIIIVSVVALHIFLTYSPKQSTEETQSKSMHLEEGHQQKDSEQQQTAGFEQRPEPPISAEGLVQRFATSTSKDIGEEAKDGGEDAQDTKVMHSSNEHGFDGHQLREVQKPKPLPEVQNTQQPESSTNADGFIQSTVSASTNLFNLNGWFDWPMHQGPTEGPKDARRGAGEDADERKNHGAHEQSQEDLKDKESRSSSDLNVILPKDTAQSEEQKLTKAMQDNILPVADKFSHGTFWVCFPPSTHKQKVKHYAKIFNEVARRQKRMVYPFCYIDTRFLDAYGESFCDDVNKVTFVLEVDKGKHDAISDSKRSEISTQSSFDDCSKALVESPHGKDGDEFLETQFESPAWFRRTFRPDRVIRASLVEEFLNDAFSGKVPEVVPTKGDLRL